MNYGLIKTTMYRFVENLESDKSFFCNSGTNALCLLLKSMEIGQGDQVLLQSFTCPAVPFSVVYLGATPVYVDIDPTTFNLDPDRIEEKVSNKTKAIIIQHTFGIPAELEPLLTVARKHGLWIIEDACHAFGSHYRGIEVGEFGDAAFYSFGWYKPVVLGAGGAAVVNNPSLISRVKEVYHNSSMPSYWNLVPLYIQYAAYATLLNPRQFWFMKEVYRRLRDYRNGRRKGKIGPLLFGYADQSNSAQHRQLPPSQEIASIPEESFPQSDISVVLQKNSNERKNIQRMLPFQKKRLFAKLDRWDVMVERQKRIVTQYRQNLSRIGHVPINLSDHLDPVYYKYPLLIEIEQKKVLFERARREKIEISDMFGSPLYPPDRKANWQALGYEQGMCPISEHTSDRIVALPVRYSIKDEDIERTITLLASCIR